VKDRVLKRRTLLTLSILLGVFAGTSAGQIVYGPVLQPTDDLAHKVGILWRTRSSQAVGIVEYGTDEEPGKAVTATARNGIGYIMLEHLKPGTTYYYRLTADGQRTRTYRFRTSPRDGRFRLLVLADTQFRRDPGKWYRKVLLADALKFQPDVVLIAGDLVDDGRIEKQWTLFFNLHEELFANAILLPVIGNHDAWQTPEIFASHFRLPRNGPEGLEGVQYSCDYGSVHFVLLRGVRNETEHQWLINDLAAARKRGVRWIFTSKHYPVYLDCLRDRELTLGGEKTRLVQAYARFGVNLEFVGHRHVYQRTFPLLPNPIDANRWGIVFIGEPHRYNAATKGTVHLQVPSANYQWTPADTGIYFPVAMEKQANLVGFVQVTVEGPRLTVEAYSYRRRRASKPTLIDRFVIDRSDKTPIEPPTISNVTVDDVGSFTAKITFQTDLPAKSCVEYWPAEESQGHAKRSRAEDVDQRFLTQHQILLAALQPQTQYAFQVVCQRGDKVSRGPVMKFTTRRAAPGDLVGEFNFQPIAKAPPEGMIPAPPHRYDAAVGYGWQRDCSAYYQPGTEPFAQRSFCAVPNGTTNTWRLDLPNGTYALEISSGMAGWFSGPVRIGVEGSAHVLTVPGPEKGTPTNHYRTWKVTVKVRDGHLDITLGGPGKKYSVINHLRILYKQPS